MRQAKDTIILEYSGGSTTDIEFLQLQPTILTTHSSLHPCKVSGEK